MLLRMLEQLELNTWQNPDEREPDQHLIGGRQLNAFDYQIHVAAEVEDFFAASHLTSSVVQDFYKWTCFMRPDMEFRRVDTRAGLVAFVQVSEHNTISVRVQSHE